MAGEGEGGLEVEWAGLEGPGGEGGDEARGLERVLVVLVECGEGEIRCDQAQRVVLGAQVEHVVRMRLALFHHAPAGGALRYRPPRARRRATPLRRRAIRALHFSLF